MPAGKLKDRVEFQQRASGTDAFGGKSETWTPQFERAVEFQHIGGSEGVEAARMAGREVYKAKVRSSAQTRAITADGWRIRDTRRNRVLNILSIDAVTDRAWVWMRVEV